MKRYFHLQILVSMLCLAVAARRHQRIHAYVLPYQPSSGERTVHTRIHVRPIPVKRETSAWPAARQLSPTIAGPWKGIPATPKEDSWRGIPSTSRSARYNLAPPLGPEPWNGGIAEPTEVQHARHETIPDVRYEESILEDSRPSSLPHNGHLFTWNADDPSFYQFKGSESKLKASKKQLPTPWKYFQERPSFYTSPTSREISSRQNEY